MKTSLLTLLMRAALVFAASATAMAQDHIGPAYEPEYASDALNVAIAIRGGMTLATPRGDFPSVIVTPSQRGTGTIGQAFGESGTGSRIEVNALIPIAKSFGISLGAGSQSIAVNYGGDPSRLPTHFVVQTLQGLIGAQWSILNEAKSYQYGGLRSVYVDGGLDIGLATMANRVESSQYADTLDGPPSAAVGSFTTSEPFRNVVALRGAVGLRFAPTANFEISAEASYSYALNPMFSSQSIEDNDFAIDVLGALIGIGYRF